MATVLRTGITSFFIFKDPSHQKSATHETIKKFMRFNIASDWCENFKESSILPGSMYFQQCCGQETPYH